MRAPGPARFPKLKPKAMKIKPEESRYERGIIGWQVIDYSGEPVAGMGSVLANFAAASENSLGRAKGARCWA